MSVIIPQTDPRANYPAHRAEIDAAIAAVLEGGRYILGERGGRASSASSPPTSGVTRRCRSASAAAPMRCTWRCAPAASGPATPSSPSRTRRSPRSPPSSCAAPRRSWWTSTRRLHDGPEAAGRSTVRRTLRRTRSSQVERTRRTCPRRGRPRPPLRPAGRHGRDPGDRAPLRPGGDRGLRAGARRDRRRPDDRHLRRHRRVQLLSDQESRRAGRRRRGRHERRRRWRSACACCGSTAGGSATSATSPG